MRPHAKLRVVAYVLEGVVLLHLAAQARQREHVERQLSCPLGTAKRPGGAVADVVRDGELPHLAHGADSGAEDHDCE